MNQIENKELLSIAIDTNDILTKSQKSIINIILNFEEMGTTNMSIASITELSGFTKTIIYKSITKLIQMKILIKYKKPGERISYFELDKNKLKAILDVYLKKQQILQKKGIK